MAVTMLEVTVTVWKMLVTAAQNANLGRGRGARDNMDCY